MSASTPIVALVIYLVLYLLPLDPVRFRWAVHRGFAPMPSEVEQKAKELDWLRSLSIQVTLLVTVVLLMRSSSMSLRSIGFSTDNWRSAVTLGAVFGVIPLGLNVLLRRSSAGGRDDDSYSNVSFSNRYGLAILSTFSSEFWRAFSITALVHFDFPPWTAVVITAVVSAVPYLYESRWTAAGVAFGCLVPGFLFVETRSLLAPLTMGLIASGHVLYDARRKWLRRATKTPTFICPACGHSVPRQENPGAGWLVCPGCGERLALSFPVWIGYIGGLVGASLTVLYFLYARNLESWFAWLLFFPAFFVFLILSTVVLAVFFPALATIGLAPVKRSLFRF